MNCSYCHAIIDNDSTFCGYCGTRVGLHAGDEMWQYAGFWARFVAALIDGVIVLVMSAVVAAPLFFAARIPNIGLSELILLVSVMGGYVVGWLYYAIMESSAKQSTFGKSMLNLKVTDCYGNRISFGRATGRYFGKILSGVLLYIGYLMAAFTEKKHGLHDMLAGCLVIKVR